MDRRLQGRDFLCGAYSIAGIDLSVGGGANIANLSVASADVLSGGMDAEYGNALSGVVSVSTKEGTDRLSGEVRWDTDRYGDPTKTFNNYDRFTYDAPSNLTRVRTNLRSYYTTRYTTLSNLSVTKTARLSDDWYGAVYGSNTAIAGQLSFYITSTQIVILSGAGAPAITSGIIDVEFLVNV